MSMDLFGRFEDNFKCNIVSGSDDIDIPALIEDEEELAKDFYELAKINRKEFYKFLYCMADTSADPDKYPTDLQLANMEKLGFKMDDKMDLFVDYIKNHTNDFSEDADPDKFCYLLRTIVFTPMEDGKIESQIISKGWFSVKDEDDERIEENDRV